MERTSGKPLFKLSKQFSVAYEDSEGGKGVVWLLEEAQKPVEASQSGVKNGKVNVGKGTSDQVELGFMNR